jgi:predicted HTH transcriptional regulator
MNVPFNDLGPESRIWIYQSNRKLSKEEQRMITSKTEKFLTEWTAHGNDLQAGVQIAHDQFIIIGVNEAVNEASGCSIDKSVNFIRELDHSLNANLLERTKVAFIENFEIRIIDFTEIKKLVADGVIKPGSKIFNNAVASKKELEESWIKPASESWISRYF